MIPRTARRGHSFHGAGLYYLHDKKAMTTERVAWTYTHNLSTDDPERAMRRMAFTSMNAEKLKHENGVDKRGRKSKAGHVYSFSLAWHPEQTPDKQHMIDSSLTVLERLGLKEHHQAVIVAHRDEAHPHVHVICNLINKENGKTASTSNDRLIMSKWAEEYELEHGKIYCESRVENNQKRKELSQDNVKAKRQKEQQDFKNGRKKEKPETGIVKHRSEKHERSELIQNLYNQSDSGKAFRAALEEEGFTLARGDRRGFVLVDATGKIHSLSRQLKGQRAADLRKRLSDIEDLKSPKEVVQDKFYYDRDKQNIEQEQRIIDAAIEAEQKKQKSERKGKPKSNIKKNEKSKREGNKTQELAEDDPVRLAHEQSKKWDERIKWGREAQRLRLQLNNKLKAYYKRDEQVKKIQDLEKRLAANDNIFGKLRGKRKSVEEELEAERKNLANIDELISYQEGALEKEIQKTNPDLIQNDKAPKKTSAELRKEFEERKRRFEQEQKDELPQKEQGNNFER